MTTAARVCIITPGHLATNPRAVKEAAALSDAGYKVTIIYGDYLPAARLVDPTLVDDRWRTLAVPFGPSQRSRLRYLFQTIRRRGARLTTQAGFGFPRRAAVALSPVSPGLASAAASVDADLYIAHYVAALPAAAAAAQRRHALYAFDAEDFHLGDLPDEPQHAFENRLIRSIEARHLPNAAYVTAASPGIADAYAAEYRIPRPMVLLNVFPKARAPSGATPRGTVVPGPTLYWFSQTIGPDRGLECALDAIARARAAPHLHLRGTPAAGFEVALRQQAAALGVSERVHLHAPGAPNEMARIAASYDVGLVSETGITLNRRIALTNKQFTYLLGGTPAVMSDVPAHVAFAKEAAGASILYRAEDSGSLAERLDSLLATPDRLAASRARAFRLGQKRFNWESESPILLACVSNALAKPGRRSA